MSEFVVPWQVENSLVRVKSRARETVHQIQEHSPRKSHDLVSCRIPRTISLKRNEICQDLARGLRTNWESILGNLADNNNLVWKLEVARETIRFDLLQKSECEFEIIDNAVALKESFSFLTLFKEMNLMIQG